MKKKRTWEQQQRVDQQNWYDEMHTTQVKLKLNIQNIVVNYPLVKE